MLYSFPVIELIPLYWEREKTFPLAQHASDSTSCIFVCRLRANEYDDFRGKLQANIENVKNIVVRQSLSELFLEDFRRLITQNPKYRLPVNQQVRSSLSFLPLTFPVTLISGFRYMHWLFTNECQCEIGEKL